MDVGATVNLESLEETRLAQVLGCATNELPEVLAPYVTAAAEEYFRLFLGQRVFTRGSDVREYRLYLLTKHAFRGVLPSEDMVSALFQTKLTESRSLLSSVLAKYQYDLEQERKRTLSGLLAGASVGDDGTGRVRVSSRILVEELNRHLGRKEEEFKPIRAADDAVSWYVIPAASLAELRTDFPAE